MKLVFKFLVLLSLLISGCSPHLENKDFNAPLMDLRPDMENDREFAKLLQQASQFELEWKGSIPSSEVHEVIQGILDMAEKTKNKKLKATAFSLYKKYYAENIGTHVSFFKTPYYEIFQTEALPSVREGFNDALKEIDAGLIVVKKKVKDLKETYPWPKKAKFLESIALLEGFLNTFLDAVPKLKLMKDFEVALVDEVKSERDINADYLKKQWALIDGTKTLTNMLNILESMVKEFEIPLDKETEGKIQSGRALAEKIDAITDETTAFSAIVGVWLTLGPKEREMYFTPISAALYKFLSGKKDQDLVCLVDTTCPKFFSAIVRDVAILPQLKKFGPDKIKITLNEKTHGYVLEILEERLLSVILALDTRVEKKVTKNVIKAKAELEKTRRNAQGFTKEKFLKWLTSNMGFKSEMSLAYENATVNVDIQKKIVTFKPPMTKKSVVVAKSVGASLASNAKIFDAGMLTDSAIRKPLIEQINRILGFGGVPGKPAPTKGIVKSFENDRTPFDVSEAVDSLISYGIVDISELSSPFLRKEVNDVANLSADAQIEIGNGLLATMKYLRDWEKNSFDRSIGNFKASSVFGSEAGGSGDGTPLFSKTEFFGLTTAQFINWIANLTKKFSQLGLVTNEGEVVWMNEYSKNKDKTFLFGVYVDIVNGQRSPDVSIKPIVKVIRLLKNIEGVIDGIERTKFNELLKKDKSDPECRDLNSPNCPTLAQVLGRRINEVKKILVPLGNTIATKYRNQKDSAAPGLAAGVITLPGMEKVDADPELMDQLLVIEGLLEVYESTKIETYLWSAKETYFLLQKYYNPKTNFFDMDLKVANVPTLIQMLRTFRLMAPYLADTERIILLEKLKIWEFSLEKLQ
tara:strand:- start:5250 stop:7841 length:2592 start_codon:yes stop_codon:yes gene_type:complete